MGKSKNTSFYIHSAICVAIMVAFQFLPPVGQITALGMKVLGIYIGLLYGWSTVSLIWPSFLGLFFLAFSGYDTVGHLITSGFGNATNVYIMLICVFSFFVTQSGVSGIIVRAIIGRKFASGRPWIISGLFLTAAYACGALISMTPACIIVWSIVCQYCKDLGYKKGDKYPVLMIVGIALAGLMGYSLFPFRVPGTTLVGMVTEAGGAVPFLSYVVCAFIIGYGSLMAYLLLCKYLFRPDVSRLAQSYDFGKTEKMTRYQKQILALTVILILAFLIQSAFPATFVGAFLTKLGTSGIVLALLMVMVFFKKKDGSSFADIIEATRKGVSWPVFYMLTIGMTMATALTADTVGVKAQLQSVLSPMLGSSGGRILLLCLTTLLILVTTNFMGNLSCAMIVFNVAALYSDTLGISPALLACVIGVLANASIVFPSANPIAAIMHGMTDWVSARDIYKYAVPLVASVWIVSTFLCLTLGIVIF